VFSFQEKDASKLAGNWFQVLMVLFTKEYLPTFTNVYDTVNVVPIGETLAFYRSVYLGS
jgi:hypothetical protein